MRLAIPIHPRLSRYFNRISAPAAIFLTLCLLVLFFNLVQSVAAFNKQQLVRADHPYLFFGFKYLGINEFLPEASRAGYLTDKNPDERLNAMEFAQAEYILLPATLDLNNADHEYLILAFSSTEAAGKAIKANGLVPLKQNRFGIILAKNPRGSRP